MSIFLEIQRYKEIKKIKKETEMTLKNHINANAAPNIDINSLLPKWFMLQYAYGAEQKDPIIPYNANKYNQLKIDLKNLYNINYTLELHNKINLTQKCNLAINNLNNNIINNLKIEIVKIDNYRIYIITEELSLTEFNTTQYKIHKEIINKLKLNYINKDNIKTKSDNIPTISKFNELVICLIIRYNTLESYNQQLAVYPQFYKHMKTKYNINTELFASSLNFFFPNYCSLYYDLEQHFGSLGNFSEFNITNEDFYVANPPFDESIMTNMSIKILKWLSNSTRGLNFFITIPVWDENSKYGRYEALEILKKSPYITFITKLEKHHSKFFDYYENKYKFPCKMYFILLQNKLGRDKYPIKNELLNTIHIMFRLNKQIGGIRAPENNESNKIISYKIQHNKKTKIKINIKYRKEPPPYKNIKTIKPSTKYSTKELIYNYIKSLEPFIKLNKQINNIALIDLTAMTQGENANKYNYIYDRLRWTYNALFNIILFKQDFKLFNMDISYLLDIDSTKDNKYDFVFISGNIEYNKLQHIKYYSEQMNYVLHIKQIIYLLNIQQKDGSAVYLISTCDTDISRKNIALLQNYYKEVYLIKNLNYNLSLSYIVCNGFLGISKTELDKLNIINISLALTNQNVFNSKLRDKYNVTLPINTDKQTNVFLDNIFDIQYSKELDKIIDNWHIDMRK
jgi:hypothetical protein